MKGQISSCFLTSLTQFILFNNALSPLREYKYLLLSPCNDNILTFFFFHHTRELSQCFNDLPSSLSSSEETILRNYTILLIRSAFCNTFRRSNTKTGQEMFSLCCSSAMNRLLQMKNEVSNFFPVPDLFDVIQSFEQFIITIKKL